MTFWGKLTVKKNKLLLATVLTLGIATFTFSNAYADSETTEANPTNATETVEIQQGDTIEGSFKMTLEAVKLNLSQHDLKVILPY